MITLFSMQASGNSYKVRLLLKLVDLAFVEINVDRWRGDMRHQEFLKLNPQGKAPLVIFEDSSHLVESNAILYFFAQNTCFWPKDHFSQAQVLRWMFFEQYYHEPNIAVRGSLLKSKSTDQNLLSTTLEGGYKALDVMEDHLQQNAYFGSDEISIADIALYGYTHSAHKAGFEMKKYPKIMQWIEAISNLDGFITQKFQTENYIEFPEYIKNNGS